MSYPYPTLTPRIPLERALERIAAFLGLDANELYQYALEDKIGGYHHDKSQRRVNDDGTLAKGIWGVEGQVVYALIRALRPRHVLEVGNCYGTSSRHIGEAILANETGKVTTLDLHEPIYEGLAPFPIPERYEAFMKPVYSDLMEFNYNTRPKLDFVFEDAYHTTEQVEHVWSETMKYAKPGAVVVSHDSEHFSVGPTVRKGVQNAIGDRWVSVAIDPADCGLIVGRKEALG